MNRIVNGNTTEWYLAVFWVEHLRRGTNAVNVTRWQNIKAKLQDDKIYLKLTDNVYETLASNNIHFIDYGY